MATKVKATTKANPTKRATKRATNRTKREATRKGKGPVALMWALCDRMAGKPRGDVVAAAVKKGINENTARTQYQRWYALNKK